MSREGGSPPTTYSRFNDQPHILPSCVCALLLPPLPSSHRSHSHASWSWSSSELLPLTLTIALTRFRCQRMTPSAHKVRGKEVAGSRAGTIRTISSVVTRLAVIQAKRSGRTHRSHLVADDAMLNFLPFPSQVTDSRWLGLRLISLSIRGSLRSLPMCFLLMFHNLGR